MIVTICGSMAFAKEMLDVKKKLEKLGYKVYPPEGLEDFIKSPVGKRKGWRPGVEGAQRKMHKDLIRGHYRRIKGSDAILVVNKAKKDRENYIGGNTFLEMGFAHVLDKKIYITNPLPKYIKYFYQELVAMQPNIIGDKYSKIS